jgi:hypothetical protein
MSGPTARRRLLILLGLAAPSLLAAVAALVLMQWHKPTRVQLDLLVDRVALTVASDRPEEGFATLIGPANVGALRAQRVGRVAFAPQALELADEARFDLEAGRFPDDAWRPLAVTGEVTLEPAREGAGAVSLESADAASPGRLRLVSVPAGAEAVMELGRETGGKRSWLGLELNTPRARADLVFPGRFLVYADDLGLAAPEGAALSAQTLSLRSGGKGNTAVEVLGSERGLVLQMETVDPAAALLAEGEIQIPVAAVDFDRQGPSGQRLSSLIGPGTLSYPDLPAMAPVALSPGELVSLEGLEGARIEKLAVADAGDRPALALTLDAVAATVRVGTPERPMDARLTWLDQLRHEPTLATLLAVVVWFFTTTLAGYKLWKELRSSSASS